MDFDRLNEFLTIARCSSIKKAALELNISSATLSARLLRFEEHLGADLFFRKADAMVLTSAGEQLLPSANEILSSYGKLQKELLSAQFHTYRHLRIAVSGSELPLYLGPFLDKLNLNHPDIRLDILDDTTHNISDGLQSGMVDLYFAPVQSDFSLAGIVKLPLAVPIPSVVLPRSHRLANRTMVSIRELSGETFILYPRTAETAIRDFQLNNLRDSGIRFQIYDSQTSGLFHVLLVPIGKGIFITPTQLMVLPPNSVSIPLMDLPHSASICCFYSKSNTNPDIAAFVKDFSNFAKELSRHEYK